MKMQTLVKVFVVLLVPIMASPAHDEDGTWHAERYGDTGKYIHVPNPYIHEDNPYDGGYGPYAHLADPYQGEASQQEQYRLVVDPPKDIPWYRPGYYNNNGIRIIQQEHKYRPDNYKYIYETENSILAEEKAKVTNPNTDDESIASAGYYQYIGPDGYLYRVDYTADENGFRPKTTREKTKYSGSFRYEKV